MRRLALGIGTLALITFGLSACGAGASDHASSSTTITLYNGQHVQTTDALVAGFESEFPDIHVAVRNDDEDTFDAEILAEGGRSAADVIYTENSPALEFLQQRGLLTGVDPTTLARTPSRFSSPEGEWVGVSARVSVLIYNPSLISERDLPTGVLELANPRYRGKLAFAAGETDFQPIVTSVLRADGKAKTLAWLNGIKANSSGHTYPDDESITNEVNRGEVAFGVVNQYYWYRLRAELGAGNIHSKIAYFAPRDPGYVIDVSGAGILRSSTHRAAAQKFLAYLVSKKGQEVIAHSISFEYPVASGVVTAEPETPFVDLKPYPIDIAELGTGAAAIALLREVQLL